MFDDINFCNKVVLGKDSKFIDFDYFERPIHCSVIFALQNLKKMANEAGFDLVMASGFRGFEQQLSIWNEKVQGKRSVLNSDEQPVDVHQLSAFDLVFTILRWSALPGASRHHWGTDFDIYDASAIKEGYKLQLTVSETEENGCFAEFYLWLNQVLSSSSCQFFRPYNIDYGGISPEPWHLSFSPLSKEYEARLSADLIRESIRSADILLKDEILKNFDEIYHRFILNSP